MSGEKATCRLVNNGVLLSVPQFDVGQIAESGQCFRIQSLSDGGFLAVTGQKFVRIIPKENGGYIFCCAWEEFRDVWLPYFDLDTDYGVYQRQMSDDPFLMAAIQAGGGIRILRQDFWEMGVTFVISQRNNIPRIRNTVECLCKNFGTQLGEIDGHEIYSFPTAEQLKNKDLACASLGYREKYIKELCNWQPGFWARLAEQNDDGAKKILLNLSGVGEKVANCVMLFGLHRMNSYPRDVWINRMIDDIYHGSFDSNRYAGYAGYVQQLQFFYYRKMEKGAGM